jgi:hypothetical protein
MTIQKLTSSTEIPILRITGPPPEGTTIVSQYICYDNSLNRIRITQHFSNGQQRLTFKTPMKGGPYAIISTLS